VTQPSTPPDELTTEASQLLDKAAAGLLERKPFLLDLSGLGVLYFTEHKQQVFEYLDRQLQALSDGHLVLRHADPAVFEWMIFGTGLYVAVCVASIASGPDERIKSLRGGMTPFIVCPEPDGCRFSGNAVTMVSRRPYMLH
jgi:hypothetical protein